ncbi:MAG TPA: methyltransferase domain-containing protein [Thermoanaerobaculia bacterium]|nr:methyltransferase domain-containing protein [Thermoanaerobaculia bacterium]
MTAADRERWEARWQARAGGPGQPEPFLAQRLAELEPGRVLDVAAGAGANALLLARRGFAVTALDIAPSALARLSAAAAAEGLEIARRAADLDHPAALDGLEAFDDLVVIRYGPTPPQWQRLLGCLRPGGILLLCSFGIAQAERTGFSRTYCLVREEVAQALGPAMACLAWHGFEQAGQALEGSLWRKAGS